MVKFLNKYFNEDNVEVLSKGSLFLIIRIFGAAIGYIFTIYITNKYGSDFYGLLALSFSFFLIISVFGRLGLDTNIVRVFSQKKNENETLLFYKSVFISFLVSSFFSIIIFLLKDFIVVNLYQDNKPELLIYLPWILLAIPFWNIALVCSSYLRAKKLNSYFAFINYPSRFLFSLLFIIIIAYFFGNHNNYVFIGHFIAVLFTAILSIIVCITKLNHKNLKSQISAIFFLKDSFPMLLSSSILILLGLIDIQVMGIYETNTNIGIYSVCLKLASLTTFSLQAINSILAPKIAKSYNEGGEKYKELIRFSTKLNFLISIFLVTIILLFQNYLLNLFGDEFVKGSLILIIFCIGQIINSFSGSVGVILQMVGKQKVYQNFVVFALIINIVLTFIFTPIYGGIGAALSTVISMAFWNILSAIYLKKKMKIKSYFTFTDLKVST